MEVRPGEEIIVQGYTCVVVPNAIHAAGATPVFADIDRETLNLSPDSVRSCITPRTRAVICQHTFGIPANTKALRALCDEHNILLIEDCAHVLPDGIEPIEIGKYGDAMLLSFGRDKAISGISGGAVLVRDNTLATRLKDEEKNASDVSWLEVLRLLEYPSRMRLLRSLLWCGLDRPAAKILGLLGLVSRVVTDEEKEGVMSPILHRIPNVCAALALYSLRKLHELNKRRRELTAFYLKYGSEHGWPILKGIRSDLPLQKFPLFVPGAEEIRRKLKKQNIHLHDGWTECVVCPEGTNLGGAGYELGDDPVAERACEQILSLPTHPTMTMEMANVLLRVIAKYLSDRKM
jgi:dTDP-4-amino-4,6-dideoxygalactose transaminase